jgi:hypothetical protein
MPAHPSLYRPTIFLTCKQPSIPPHDVRQRCVRASNAAILNPKVNAIRQPKRKKKTNGCSTCKTAATQQRWESGPGQTTVFPFHKTEKNMDRVRSGECDMNFVSALHVASFSTSPCRSELCKGKKNKTLNARHSNAKTTRWDSPCSCGADLLLFLVLRRAVAMPMR